ARRQVGRGREELLLELAAVCDLIFVPDEVEAVGLVSFGSDEIELGNWQRLHGPLLGRIRRRRKGEPAGKREPKTNDRLHGDLQPEGASAQAAITSRGHA